MPKDTKKSPFVVDAYKFASNTAISASLLICIATEPVLILILIMTFAQKLCPEWIGKLIERPKESMISYEWWVLLPVLWVEREWSRKNDKFIDRLVANSEVEGNNTNSAALKFLATSFFSPVRDFNWRRVIARTTAGTQVLEVIREEARDFYAPAPD